MVIGSKATSAVKFACELIIRKIRHTGAQGGVIFSGVATDGSNQRYVVKASYKLAPAPKLFRPGHKWSVSGSVSEYVVKLRDGSTRTEMQITADSLVFLRADNDNIEQMLRSIEGVGESKAKNLAKTLGARINQIAMAEDTSELEEHCSPLIAARIVQVVRESEVFPALQLFDECGIPTHLASQAIKIWKHKSYEIFSTNPYFLSAFEPSMKLLDEVAIKRFGFEKDSPERLIAFVKSALFNAFEQGHTCLPTKKLKTRLTHMLGDQEIASRAIESAMAQGEIEQRSDLIQVSSMVTIESSVAKNSAKLLSRYFDIPDHTIQSSIDKYQSGIIFPLTDEQKAAISVCVKSGISLLTGGAGCGKTTVLEGICAALEDSQQTSKIYLMAISGQAAKRIQEATGRDAMTIAAFLYHVDSEDIPEDATIIVDEGSMVDTLALNMILKRVPSKGRCLIAGDPEQLSPVGVGLTLHKMVDLPFPNPHLSAVKRQSSASGIPQVATAIRNYDGDCEVEFADYDGKGSGVSFIEVPDHLITSKVIELYSALGGDGESNDVLILSPVRNHSGGVVDINRNIHDKVAKSDNRLLFDTAGFKGVNALIDGVPLCVGDLIMTRRNDYERGFRNGSIGRVTSFDSGSQAIQVDMEGVDVIMSFADTPILNMAYATTVHKSQGSQYPRVIIAVKESRLLDRHLFYTAVTRAREQVVIVGDRKAFTKALSKSKAFARHTLLDVHLSECHANLNKNEPQGPQGL
ncbi:AAA family ATPase [Paraferrimonas haliotis]|uniref:ATPase AAA n=1 Tax=Paraferrimonas haliotis TaxID=2013866 RepID=A0AA37TNI3_9GAMM|nr:AAA family ATPase [Paraferrimonas haliotis]GLS83743.1 ATPase AAA [Paraferrimonas haliotis]